jgi:hypothetical protein
MISLEKIPTELRGRILIEMTMTVRPDLSHLAKPGTILRAGHRYQAISNRRGIISAFCHNGEKLGVKPGEFRFILAPEKILKRYNICPECKEAS